MSLLRSIGCAVVVAVLLSLASAACGKAVAERVDDASITAHVKTALLNDAHVAATNINVATTNGVVTISGSVKSKAEEMRAVEIARQTPGVRDVKSELQVSSTPPS